MSSLVPPSSLGPYRILRKLGEGGMGEVYEAMQTEPVKRIVALKVLRSRASDRNSTVRFEAEQQALAMMDHPGIARVFDAGVSDDGQQYFAMELVAGSTITDYANEKGLGLNDRLQLFRRVCLAVQHAHQKGIIHRDLKPSNVLISAHEGSAEPKVIDFGVAKAVGLRLTEDTLVTQFGMVIGTPAYMSPEQAEGTNLDVDTRSDVYSLGVMLYELLVGCLPVDPKDLGYPGFISYLKSKDTEPPTPSARFTTLDENLQVSTASRRGTNPGKLREHLAGDLDWIVMSALDKDRSRRYDSAGALAADIERYLNREPILARPPSTTYRIRKFVARNRLAVVAASAVFLALTVGTLAALIGLVRANRAQQEALNEAATAQEVTDFMVQLFDTSNPKTTRGQEVTAREILDIGSERIAAQIGTNPLVRARLLAAMGRAYHDLGEYESSVPLLREAAMLLEQNTDDLEAITDAYAAWGISATQLGDNDLADSLYRSSLALLDRANNGAYSWAKAEVTTKLVFSLLRRNVALQEGESLLTNIVELQNEAGESDSIIVGRIWDAQCYLYINKGDHAAAEEPCTNAAALALRLQGEDAFETGLFAQRLGQLRRVQGRYEEALSLFRQALAVNQKILSGEHSETAFNYADIGRVFRQMGWADSALIYIDSALAINRRVLPPNHFLIGEGLFQRAGALWEAGRQDESMEALGEALGIEQVAIESRDSDPYSRLADWLRNRARYVALEKRFGNTDAAERAADEMAARVAAALDDGTLSAESPPLALNSVCWLTSLGGRPRTALRVCDLAVAASDDGNRPRIRDSRGVARAMLGLYEAAIDDFQAYVERPANVAGVPARQAWIQELREGRNPFSGEAFTAMLLNP